MLRSLSCSLFAVLLLASVSLADPRPFTFVYDTYPVGKGNFELEQWVTAKNHTENTPSYERYDFRTELEIGIAENFDLSIYAPKWRYEETPDHTGTKFDGVAIEGILYLSNPVTDKVGFGLYGEISIGEDALAFEQKLIVHKDIDQWTLAYNLIVETEIEGVGNAKEENEIEGVLGHAFGVSYSLSPAFRVGAEALVESEFEDWDDYVQTSVYAGPNINYQAKNWWLTVTPMFQLSDLEDEPDFEVRMIFGYAF